MRNIIFLLVIAAFFGCKDDSKELESLEIMSYYYVPNYKTKKQELDFLLYSIVDSEGNAKVIKKIVPMSKQFLFYKTKIEQNLIDKLSKNNLNKNEEFYNNSNKINKPDIYCGPIKRIRLKYRNGHQFSFFYTYEQQTDIYEFTLLLNKLEKLSRTTIENIVSIKNNQKLFQSFAIEKDTTILPFPPFPKLKIDEVKFIKPH